MSPRMTNPWHYHLPVLLENDDSVLQGRRERLGEGGKGRGSQAREGGEVRRGEEGKVMRGQRMVSVERRVRWGERE